MYYMRTLAVELFSKSMLFSSYVAVSIPLSDSIAVSVQTRATVNIGFTKGPVRVDIGVSLIVWYSPKHS